VSLLTLIITFGAAVAVVTAFIRWVWPQITTGARVLIAFKNAVLGTDEVTHPDTGAVVVPAQPGMGNRMATLEVAVTELVRNNRRLDNHEARLDRLEKGVEERTVNRTESVEMLRVIDTALRTPPREDQ
jgi:hypothetical protein